MNGHFNKRGRNQRRRQGVNPNRALDSNGPDVRIRGTAQQIYDKYLALARDATSVGDRVKTENYLQHAEHYFRALRAAQGTQGQPFDQSGDSENDGDQPSINDQRQSGSQFESDAPDADSRNDSRNDSGNEAREASRNGASDNRPAENRGPTSGQMSGQTPAQGGGGNDSDRGRRRRRPRRPNDDEGSADAGAETSDETPEPVVVS